MPYANTDLEKLNWEIASRLRTVADPQNVYELTYLAWRIAADRLDASDPFRAVHQAAKDDLDVEEVLLHAFKGGTDPLKLPEIVRAVGEFDPEAVEAYLAHGPFPTTAFYGENVTPDGLAELALAILDVEPGDTVVDLGSGTGTFLELAASAQPQCHLTGVDASMRAVGIAKMRSSASGSAVEYAREDMFDYFAQELASHKADKVFSNYPFGMRAKFLEDKIPHLDGTLLTKAKFSRPLSGDWIFNSLLVDSIEPTGTAVGIMSNGAASNGRDRDARRFFVENGLVKAVVALPAGLFAPYVNIETSLVVLCAGGSNTVKFVDATGLGTKERRKVTLSASDIEAVMEWLVRDSGNSKTVYLDEVAAHDFDLYAPRYLQAELAIPCPVELSSVCIKILRGSSVRASELDAITCPEDTGISYLNLADISDGSIEEHLPHLKQLDPKLEKCCIQNGDVLLSKSGTPSYKVAVAEIEEGQKVLANGNLYILRLDRKTIDPYYLAAFLQSPLGKAALARIEVGTTISNLPLNALTKMDVPLESPERQAEVAAVYQAKIDEIKVLKLDIENARAELNDLFETEG